MGYGKPFLGIWNIPVTKTCHTGDPAGDKVTLLWATGNRTLLTNEIQ
jgi:hypothetical protein